MYLAKNNLAKMGGVALGIGKNALLDESGFRIRHAISDHEWFVLCIQIMLVEQCLEFGVRFLGEVREVRSSVLEDEFEVR